jgi:hypothetical protein
MHKIFDARLNSAHQEKEAGNQLEGALTQARALNNSIPPLYEKLLEEIEELVTRGEKLMGDYQTLRDRHFEACYLAELIGNEIDLPSLYRMDTTRLPVLAQRIRMLTQLPSSPNTAIK